MQHAVPIYLGSQELWTKHIQPRKAKLCAIISEGQTDKKDPNSHVMRTGSNSRLEFLLIVLIILCDPHNSIVYVQMAEDICKKHCQPGAFALRPKYKGQGICRGDVGKVW